MEVIFGSFKISQFAPILGYLWGGGGPQILKYKPLSVVPHFQTFEPPHISLDQPKL